MKRQGLQFTKSDAHDTHSPLVPSRRPRMTRDHTQELSPWSIALGLNREYIDLVTTIPRHRRESPFNTNNPVYEAMQRKNFNPAPPSMNGAAEISFDPTNPIYKTIQRDMLP